ncbi:leucine aminopeptidase [Acrasis kona]|uniref:Leucine aminopeptidase n=1 Tax=Acrasis kona TaxID=1008807 RepID=A0AAW2Z3I9_9EUKA
MIGLKSSYEPIYDQVVSFVGEQGRMKFVRPLYVALNKAEGGRQIALDCFKKQKSGYHQIAQKMIERDLK